MKCITVIEIDQYQEMNHHVESELLRLSIVFKIHSGSPFNIHSLIWYGYANEILIRITSEQISMNTVIFKKGSFSVINRQNSFVACAVLQSSLNIKMNILQDLDVSDQIPN